jgi:glutamine amidotransferase
MCRLLAYAGPPILLETLLVEPRASLISQSLAAREARTVVNGDGCGIGWYGERAEPGVYRGILPAWSDANLVSLCGQIRSGMFVAHVRSATSGEVSTANCHPFADGRHLFMHNGQIGGYARLRRAVDAMIPDALYHRRRGTSDSEAIFLAALGRGLADDPVAALGATLADIEARAAEQAVPDPLRFAAVHADGDRLWAYRWSSDGQPPTLYWRKAGEGVVVASEPCDAGAEAWSAVPPDSVMTIGRDGSRRIAAFRRAEIAQTAA